MSKPVVHQRVPEVAVYLRREDNVVAATPLLANYQIMRAAIRRSGIIVTTVDADILALAQSVKGSVSRNVREIEAMDCDDSCEMHYGRCFSDESHNARMQADFGTLFAGPVRHRKPVKRIVK